MPRSLSGGNALGGKRSTKLGATAGGSGVFGDPAPVAIAGVGRAAGGSPGGGWGARAAAAALGVAFGRPPAVAGTGPIPKRGHPDRKREAASLSRSERHPLEALELLHGPPHARLRIRDEEKRGLVSRDSSGVRDVDLHVDDAV